MPALRVENGNRFDAKHNGLGRALVQGLGFSASSRSNRNNAIALNEIKKNHVLDSIESYSNQCNLVLTRLNEILLVIFCYVLAQNENGQL